MKLQDTINLMTSEDYKESSVNLYGSQFTKNIEDLDID